MTLSLSQLAQITQDPDAKAAAQPAAVFQPIASPATPAQTAPDVDAGAVSPVDRCEKTTLLVHIIYIHIPHEAKHDSRWCRQGHFSNERLVEMTDSFEYTIE
jgi:hypothetical protein